MAVRWKTDPRLGTNLHECDILPEINSANELNGASYKLRHIGANSYGTSSSHSMFNYVNSALVITLFISMLSSGSSDSHNSMILQSNILCDVHFS